MNIRNLLITNFPLGSTETTNGLTVSNEGFGDTVRRIFSIVSKVNPPPAEIEEWLKTVLLKNPTLTPIEDGVVTVGKQYAKFFTRGDKGITSVASEVEKDLIEYLKLQRKYTPLVSANSDAVRRVRDELHRFEKADKRQDQGDDFIKLVAKWEGYLKKPVVEVFNEPNFVFLGYGKQPIKTTNGNTFMPEPVVSTGAVSIAVPVLDSASVTKLTASIKRLWVLRDDLGSLAESVSGIDMTDGAWATYRERVFNGEYTLPYAVGVFEEENTWLLRHLEHRVNALAIALSAYLKNATVLS